MELSALQQRQVQLSQSSGGLGISSCETRCHAAYVGRTLRQVLLGLPSDEPAIQTRLLQCTSVLAPSDLGVSAKTMSTLFPPELLAWAATPDDAVTVQAWLHWLYSEPAAVQFQLANRRQSAISHAVERVLLAQYKQAATIC